MNVAEPHMELNQESQQLNVEQSLGGRHEECVLTRANTGEELEVDIVESDENNIATTDEEDPDASEYSSSFSDTASEDADMLCNGLAEEYAEVESHYWDETDLGPAYDSFSSIFHYRSVFLLLHCFLFYLSVCLLCLCLL